MDSGGAEGRTGAGLAPGGTHPPNNRVGTYVAALTAFAVVLGASWVHWYGVEFGPRFALGAAALAAVLLLADALPVRVNERHEINVVDVALLVGVAVLGPFWTALAALPLAAAPARREPLRAAYEAGSLATEVYAAGAVFSLVSGPLLAGAGGPAAPVVYGTLLAGAAMVGANHAANAVLLHLKYGMGARELWEELAEPYLLAHALNVLTAGAAVLALISYGPAAAVLLVAGSVASQALVRRSHGHAEENRRLRSEVASLREALGEAGASFGAMVVEDLGRKDGYTDRHAAATSVYAADLAREMKLGEARAERVRVAGLLHDLGKFGLPDELLLSVGRPNSVGQRELAEHPARGERMLGAVSGFGDVASWVRWHHERPDGRGYPDKLRGPWIPLEAKILAVAQAYAGLVLDGPSRPGVSPREARERLIAGMDAEFDGAVVKAFARILDVGSEGYGLADDPRFVFPGPRAGEPAGRSASPRSPAEDGRP